MDFYDTWYKFLPFLILVLGLEPKTLRMLGKDSTTKVHLQPNLTKISCSCWTDPTHLAILRLRLAISVCEINS